MATARPRPKRYLRKLEARKPCKHGPTGIELRPYQIVLRPLITEKGTHQASRYNTYAFMVNPLATKDQIQDAVEELFNVRVDQVRTQNRRGKKTSFRRVAGKQPSWKKALVTVNAEDRIDFI